MCEVEQLTLGLYPNARGYGYALFNENNELLDHGNPKISPVNNEKCLKRIRSHLEEVQPSAIILRDDATRRFRGTKRTSALLTDIKRIAQDMKIHVFCYSRKDTRRAFEKHSVTNKQDIAEKICDWLPAMHEKLPPVRKPGDSQHPRMSRFDAIALVYTHLHYTN